MATVNTVLKELKKLGNPLRVQAYAPHGGPSDMYGVSIADLKTVAKKIKGEHELALELYKSGNADAMYLAGIVADGKQMNKRELNSWASKASWSMISEYTVPGVAAESKHAVELAKKWIDAKTESVASTGWCTYAGVVSILKDEELDLKEIKDLLKRVEKEIDSAPNRVRYTMNGFVIAVGTYVESLNKVAKATAKKLGVVDVDMNGTTCKVPVALDKIAAVEAKGRVGKKRRTVKC